MTCVFDSPFLFEFFVSLFEVAEFKEKRKNSQVRFEDESEDMASERNNMHRDYFAILDRESAEREAAAKTAAEREAAENAAKNVRDSM